MVNLHLFFFSSVNSDARGLLTKFGDIDVLNHSQQTFSDKVQVVHILGFGSQTISWN